MYFFAVIKDCTQKPEVDIIILQKYYTAQIMIIQRSHIILYQISGFYVNWYDLKTLLKLTEDKWQKTPKKSKNKPVELQWTALREIINERGELDILRF